MFFYFNYILIMFLSCIASQVVSWISSLPDFDDFGWMDNPCICGSESILQELFSRCRYLIYVLDLLLWTEWFRVCWKMTCSHLSFLWKSVRDFNFDYLQILEGFILGRLKCIYRAYNIVLKGVDSLGKGGQDRCSIYL